MPTSIFRGGHFLCFRYVVCLYLLRGQDDDLSLVNGVGVHKTVGVALEDGLVLHQTEIGHTFDLEHFQVINARIPQIIATPMHTALAILLKSKKPLPVTVIAQAIAKMVMRTKAILITFRMTPFFMQSHSFIKLRFAPPKYFTRY